MGNPIRLQKILAQSGFGSRRACESYILEGRVMVDGTLVRELGAKADPELQSISLDGQRISGPGRMTKGIKDQQKKVYYVLNKPTGVLCTNEDPDGRPLAVNMIPEKRRIFCVGRLDKDSEGLLLLTNDGDLTQKLTHPSFGMSKVYLAKVDGMISQGQVDKLKTGVYLAEGKTKGAYVRVRKKRRKSSTLELTISEGMNRQIRRMLSGVNLKCRTLKRTQIGPIKLGSMPRGSYRHLTHIELELLLKALNKKKKTTTPLTRDTTPLRKAKEGPFQKRAAETDGRHRPWERKPTRKKSDARPDTRKKTQGERSRTTPRSKSASTDRKDRTSKKPFKKAGSRKPKDT